MPKTNRSDYWSQSIAEIASGTELIMKDDTAIREHIRRKIKLSKAAVEIYLQVPPVLRSLAILTCPADMAIFIQFLQSHYKASEDAAEAPYAFIYTEDIVRGFFAGCDQVTCLAVFDELQNTMLGCICGATRELCYAEARFQTMVTNFLCIHMNHRDSGLAPYLIDELCLHSSLTYHIRTGMFTCGYKVHPNYFDNMIWYHRLIDIDSVYRTGYLRGTQRQLYKRLYETFKPDPTHVNIMQRLSQPHHAVDIHTMLMAYLSRNYDCYYAWTLRDIEHLLQNPAFHCYISRSSPDAMDLFIFFEIDYRILQTGETLKHLYLYIWAFSKQEASHIEQAFENMAAYIHHHKVASVITFSMAFPVRSPHHIKALEGGGLYYYFYNVSCPKLNPHAKNAIVMI